MRYADLFSCVGDHFPGVRGHRAFLHQRQPGGMGDIMGVWEPDVRHVCPVRYCHYHFPGDIQPRVRLRFPGDTLTSIPLHLRLSNL